MKRLYILLVVSFFISSTAVAQVFGNEWINYSQKYLKIKVPVDGIYRLDSTTLSNSLNALGIPLGSIDARKFQLFHDGQEEYIWLAGDSDGVFNAVDVLEFYGKHNDGLPDSSLYTNGNVLLDPYFSLFSDTSIYFLTWNSSLSNRRYTNANDTAFSTYIPSPYFMNSEKFFGSAIYFAGVQNSLGMTDPAFISTEGFFEMPTYYGQTTPHILNSSNAYTGIGSPFATLSMKIGTQSNDWTLSPDNHIQIQFLSTTFDTTSEGYTIANYYFDSIPASSLGPANTTINLSSINPGNQSVSSGMIAAAYIVLDYPHTPDMEGRTLFSGLLPDNTLASKSLLRMTNISGTGVVYVFDLFNHQRMLAVDSGIYFKVLVENGNGSPKPFVMVDESRIIPVGSLTPVANSGSFTDFSTYAADSAFVIVSHKSLMGVSVQYKNYRSSAAGGNRNVVLADVDELYDQFAWGIGKDPLSIRHFANFMITTYPSPPAQLLLMGKSVYSDLTRIFPTVPNLVPSFGYPPCDNSLTAGLNNTMWEPAIPTGRIAAQDSAQAQWYLNKVISYESQLPGEWMKYVLHFGGGTTYSEQQQLAGYLNSYKTIIQDTSFGGIVQTYLKTSSLPIQINQSDSLRDRINAGVSIMTFFGHASGTSFDQSIDDPETYNNIDRYPFLLANSCYAGDIHSTGISSSEAFTLIDQKGTIGYLASVGIGLSGYLDIYSSRLYTSIGQTLYGKPIGDCIKWTVANAQLINPSDILLKSTLMEMTLEGDPAIILNSFPLPDYEVTNADVWLDQLTQPDSIIVYAKVTNLGRAINDSMIVQLFRKYPNGDSAIYYKQVLTPKFRDTISFTIPVNQQLGIGLNKIRIWVDYMGFIDEMDEDNNKTSDMDMLIHGSAIIPVYPYEYAVIPTDTITLKACTVNPMEPIRTYRFELDTTDLFNSAFKQTYVVAAPGGVVTWVPNLITANADSMVYFWRVSPDSLSSADVFVWRQFSFQYIPNQVGWGQDHIYQFTKDGYQFVQLDRQARHFNFVDDIKNISVKNGIYFVGVPWNESWYKINGATEAIFSCVSGEGGNGVTIAVINPISLVPDSWNDTSASPIPLPDGYVGCVGTPTSPQTLHAFDFYDSDTTNQNYIANFLNSIPAGYRVLVYSQDYPAYTRVPYNSALQLALQNIGCDTIGTSLVPDTCAFIAWGIRGVPGSATEIVGANKSSVITLNDTLNTNWKDGFIASPLIGPAAAWGSFYWKQHPVELPDYDSVYVELHGINNNGIDSLLVKFPEDSVDVNTLLPYVNAATYPYIRLVARMKDDTSRTPPQMDRWHVLYTPAPDLAVNPPLAFSFQNDTVQEGQNAKLIVAIQNLTPWSFNDSLMMTYWVIDDNHNRHNLPSKMHMPFLFAYNWFADTVTIPTLGLAGINELWLEANPVGNSNTMREQYHFNNILMVPFTVSSDRINPLLDVTFDGVHIMDRDIVSGKPGILVTLKDENQFLALNDSMDFQVFLKTPSQSSAVLIPWNPPNLVFIKAVLPNNSCKILFNPICTEDGIYELIVQAKDRSNNESGMIDYKISFEVINKPSITNVLNYPNPFSSSTQFVFTLTGTEVPSLFTVQIMTITGKVVREIDRDEFGDLHIGRNVTGYAWDGRDEYGDQLANGVYLYRIITRLNGETIEQRESGADPYIMHGWGKMYLMR